MVPKQKNLKNKIFYISFYIFILLSLAGCQDSKEFQDDIMRLCSQQEADQTKPPNEFKVTPKEAVELCKQISNECENLELKGVMTIGAPGDTDCLDLLAQCRDEVASALDMSPKELGLSMGMSNDYEVAIAKGSTNVRVGSTIFGARDYSNLK